MVEARVGGAGGDSMTVHYSVTIDFESSEEYTRSDLYDLFEAFIEQNIAKRPCMVAVGARHLLGNDGLIAMLRRKGYTVEAVK